MKKRIFAIVLLVLACCVISRVSANENVRFSYNELEIEGTENSTTYMREMIPFYIENNSYVKNKLDDGYPCVFLFEGASPNSDENFYTSRTAAYAVVVKKDEDNRIVVIGKYTDCSTLPDNPIQNVACSELQPTKGSATIKDGVYALYTCNHIGEYAAFNLREISTPNEVYSDATRIFRGVYVGSDGYQEMECNGINLHTRRGYAPDMTNSNPRSEGCQLLSFQTEHAGNYNAFMEIMVGKDNARFSTFATDDLDVLEGILIVDRYCYSEKMNELYDNKAAVDCITAFSLESRKAFEQARVEFVTTKDNYKILCMAYLKKCQGGVCYNPYRNATVVVKKAPIRTLPCTENGSEASVQLECLKEGDSVTVTGKITNPRGNIFFEVVDSYNRIGYIYSENIEF